MKELQPSQIRYSQATISTVFDTKSRHSKKRIEDTLEEICEGRQTISNIPLITVCWYKDQWYTTDNRRLWIFKHLEALEKCTTINVNETERSKVDDRKFNTCNEGISVGFRTPFAPEPSGFWYKKAVNAMNDRLSQSATTSGKEADSPVRELETDTNSKSDSIISDTQDSGVEINSEQESSNSNSNGEGIPKTESQEDSTVKIGSPDNEDDPSLDPLNECNDKADRKDTRNDKLQSDDVPTSNDEETGKMNFSFDEPSPSAELDRDHNSKHNTTFSSRRQDHIIYQRSDQVHQFAQEQSQNDQDLIPHTQMSIQDQNFNEQLKVIKNPDLQIQDEAAITESSGHEGENSLKRSRAGVEEESDYFNKKLKRTDAEKQTNFE